MCSEAGCHLHVWGWPDVHDSELANTTQRRPRTIAAACKSTWPDVHDIELRDIVQREPRTTAAACESTWPDVHDIELGNTMQRRPWTTAAACKTTTGQQRMAPPSAPTAAASRTTQTSRRGAWSWRSPARSLPPRSPMARPGISAEASLVLPTSVSSLSPSNKACLLRKPFCPSCHACIKGWLCKDAQPPPKLNFYGKIMGGVPHKSLHRLPAP